MSDKKKREYAASVQMTTTFPNHRLRKLIQQLIDDEAQISGVNKGVVSSSILRKELLPLRGYEAMVFEETVLDDERSIIQSLSKTFGRAAVMRENDIASEIVDFLLLACELSYTHSSTLDLAESSKTTMLKNALECIALTDDDMSQHAEKLKDNAPEAYPFFAVALEVFDKAGSKRELAVYLKTLCRLCAKDHDTSADRQLLLEACLRSQARRVESERQKLIEIFGTPVEVHLGAGKVLRCPANYLLFDMSADESLPRFAATVTVDNVKCPPAVIVLSNRPFQGMPADAVEEFLKAVALHCPAILAALDNQVHYKYSKNGGVSNREEYNSAPKVRIIPIPQALRTDVQSELQIDPIILFDAQDATEAVERVSASWVLPFAAKVLGE